jgi:hypothetical protein
VNLVVAVKIRDKLSFRQVTQDELQPAARGLI